MRLNDKKGKIKMKKIIALLCVVLTLLFTACGSKNSNNTNTDSSQQTTINNNEEQVSTQDIETYRIYADHGAVLLWSDPKTGEYGYKLKCENCGYVEDHIREESKKGIHDGYSCMECSYSNSLIIVCEKISE